MNNEILLLSDDLDKSQVLIQDLQEHDLKIQADYIAHHLQQDLCQVEPFIIILLDIHHSLTPILELMNKLRSFIHLNLLVLSPSFEEQDCLNAFSHGADDYLKKPILIAELVARIKAIQRRTHNQLIDEATLSYGGLFLNCLTRQASLNDQILLLTNSEFNVLEIFLRYPGRVLSKEQLTEYSLGRKYTAFDRSIDVHISNLRQKLNEDHHDESWIKTIRGYGYAFVAKG
jgi:two-component system, OmpR family, response regulator CpxR